MNNFDYSDVNLVPRRCVVKSRKECDTTVKLGTHSFKIPVVPANMPAIINEAMCRYLAENGYFYIYHRFNHNNIDFMQMMKQQNLFTSISIGFEDNTKLYQEMQSQGLAPDFVTVDVAHADSVSLKSVVQTVKQAFPNCYLIVGNISTVSAIENIITDEIYELIDCVKVGIAPGRVCITQQKTGFGSRGNQMATVKKIADFVRAHPKSNGKVQVIADGGVTSCGDVLKALVVGADLVMCGSLFSGVQETPGEIIEVDGKLFKEYYGSASLRNKTVKKNIEGKNILVAYKGELQSVLTELKEDIQSGISYGGGKILQDLRNVDFDFLHA